MSQLHTGRHVPAGKYKRLMRGDVVVMSNTPDELRDIGHWVHNAYGNILVNGLGMGCLIKILLERKQVHSIAVIEKSADVIKLVAPYFTDKRLKIIHADAFEYKPAPGARYDFVWHDIWDYICGDNLPEMARLHRKYGRLADWQDSWAKRLCKQYSR